LKILITILIKVIAREFYRSNAAFFLVAIGICFGFMSSVEHKALGEFFISSYLGLLIPVLIWIGYSLKVIQFNKKIFIANENEFLFNLQLIDKKTRWIILSIVILAQLLPILAYAIFLIAMALLHTHYLIMTCIVLLVVVLIGMSMAMLEKNLSIPGVEEKTLRATHFFNTRFYRHHLQFFLESIVQNDVMAVVGSKFFACILLIGILNLYATDIYDWRLVAMGVTIAMTGNIVLIYKYQAFQEQQLSFLRNLPLSISVRLTHFILTFSILCMTELGILIKKFPVNLSRFELIYTLLFCYGMLTVLYSSLYIKQIQFDRLMTQCFTIVIILIVFILFKVNFLLLALTLIGGGIVIFKKYYYQFELVAEKNDNNAHIN
jgi:hypothetical protein